MSAVQHLDLPAEIHRWLLLAQSLRAPVSLRSLNASKGASCLILGSDPLSHSLWIDAPPTPPPASGTPLLLSLRIDGALVEFRSRFLRADSASRWQLEFPQRLSCLQRRAALRIRCDEGPGQARIRDGLLTREGQLLDVSELGVGLRVSGPLESSIGSQLACELDVGPLRLQADTELRSTLKLLRGTRLGLRFLRLSPAQQERLQHQIFRWHRDRVRTLPA